MFKFRKVEEKDFRKLYDWLNSKNVKEFWYPDSSFTFDEISEKYKDRIAAGKVDMFIIINNGTDIGYIQSYYIEETSPFRISKKSKGIDLYIGDPSFIHKGFGKDIICDYINKHIFIDSHIENVGIDPEVGNVIAIRAYEKAGFRHVNTEIDKHSNKLTYYMVLKRS